MTILVFKDFDYVSQFGNSSEKFNAFHYHFNKQSYICLPINKYDLREHQIKN